jgi:hypothetical protein
MTLLQDVSGTLSTDTDTGWRGLSRVPYLAHETIKVCA